MRLRSYYPAIYKSDADFKINLLRLAIKEPANQLTGVNLLIVNNDKEDSGHWHSSGFEGKLIVGPDVLWFPVNNYMTNNGTPIDMSSLMSLEGLNLKDRSALDQVLHLSALPNDYKNAGPYTVLVIGQSALPMSWTGQVDAMIRNIDPYTGRLRHLSSGIFDGRRPNFTARREVPLLPGESLPTHVPLELFRSANVTPESARRRIQQHYLRAKFSLLSAVGGFLG